MRPPELSTGQLAALYLEALRLSDRDPEALIAARHLGDALDRRRGLAKASVPRPAAKARTKRSPRQPA